MKTTRKDQETLSPALLDFVETVQAWTDYCRGVNLAEEYPVWDYRLGVWGPEIWLSPSPDRSSPLRRYVAVPIAIWLGWEQVVEEGRLDRATPEEVAEDLSLTLDELCRVVAACELHPDYSRPLREVIAAACGLYNEGCKAFFANPQKEHLDAQATVSRHPARDS